MIDLHTHSTASDGSLTPAELVALARERGITHLALTDHNTARGLPEFLGAAEGSGIVAIPGAEITCELEGEELHILAMNLPRDAFAKIEELMAAALRRGEESRRALVARLREAGYDIDYDEIQAAHPDSLTNRAHIALALVEKGYVPTVRAAFDTLLCEEAGYYRPARRLQAAEAVEAIGAMGAVPIWAHPFLRLEEGQVRRALETLVPLGLRGMEVWYATYTPVQIARAEALAREFGLLPSGGSDFHGTSKPDILLGTGRGNLNIGPEVAEEILNCRL